MFVKIINLNTYGSAEGNERRINSYLKKVADCGGKVTSIQFVKGDNSLSAFIVYEADNEVPEQTSNVAAEFDII